MELAIEPVVACSDLQIAVAKSIHMLLFARRNLL
jgi:hypothetical protein